MQNARSLSLSSCLFDRTSWNDVSSDLAIVVYLKLRSCFKILVFTKRFWEALRCKCMILEPYSPKDVQYVLDPSSQALLS